MKVNLIKDVGVIGIETSFNVFEAQALVSKSSEILKATSLSTIAQKYRKRNETKKGISADSLNKRIAREWLRESHEETIVKLFENAEKMHVFMNNLFADTPAFQDVERELFTVKKINDEAMENNHERSADSFSEFGEKL